MTNPAGGVVVAQLDGTTLVGSRHDLQQSRPTDGGCWNPLQRSLAIGSELVTVGMAEMQFTDRASLAARDSVSWGTTDQYGCYMYVS